MPITAPPCADSIFTARARTRAAESPELLDTTRRARSSGTSGATRCFRCYLGPVPNHRRSLVSRPMQDFDFSQEFHRLRIEQKICIDTHHTNALIPGKVGRPSSQKAEYNLPFRVSNSR